MSSPRRRAADRATPVIPSEFRSARDRLVADHALKGVAFRRALCELSDAWLAEVFTAALASGDVPDGELALVALGGYGRGELWPNSDLDLAVVHRHRTDQVAHVAEAVWYPVWDTGVHLGHRVRSIDDAVAMIGDDIESSTELLDARLVAGNAEVFTELSTRVRAGWDATWDRSVRWLHADADARRERNGDVAFAMEPNLKSGGGGLRDAQIPSWIATGRDLIQPTDVAELDAARTWLGDVRLALHRSAPGSGDVLHLEEQDEVAHILGVDDADVLMTAVAGAARRVDWVLDEMWDQVHAIGRRSRRRWRRNGKRRGVEQSGSQFRVDDAPDATDPAAVLGHVADAARSRRRLDRGSLADFATATPAPHEPWDVATREAFVHLLSAGDGMIRVVEALDHVGVWERFVPEWPAVSSRAQRTPYHRFTVDRHLLETVVGAAARSDRVGRPDLLVTAALLHDLGKGRAGDHTEIGVHLAGVVATRMGFDEADTAVLAKLVDLHLLLPEVATRRDLDDPATIASVADSVGSEDLLTLLATLTEADALATGPAAWTEWKAGLVYTLVHRVDAQLSGTVPDGFGRTFPTREQQQLLDEGVGTVRGTGRCLTVVAPTHPRTFCRVAGALVLAGLNVTSAMATTSEEMVLEEFTVAPAFAPADDESTEIDWPGVIAAVEDALTGRVAIAARVADRVVNYPQRPRGGDGSIRVHFDDVGGDGSQVATVVEVDAPDRIGVLFAITQALTDLDVEIRYARIETRTDRVTDAFSIVDADGATIHDDAFRAEITRAIHHALES